MKQSPSNKVYTLLSILLKIYSSYYANESDISGELLHKNILSSHLKITCCSHVKRSPLLWLDNNSHLLQQKTLEVNLFGISLAIIW